MAGKTRGKGEGSIWQRADGRWYGVIEAGWGETRRRRTVSGTQKHLVLKRMRALQGEIDSGVVGADVTLTEWLTHWQKINDTERGLKASTITGYQSYIDTWIGPRIGHVRLRKLTVDHIRLVYDAMRDAKKSPTSIRQCHAILSRSLKVAEREQRISRNVAALIDAPSPDHNPHATLTPTQAKRVLRAAQTPREQARLTCALILGLRKGEALGLRWPAIDLRRGTMEISDALQVLRGTGPAMVGLKTKASRRQIPLPREVVAILAAYKQVAPDPVWVFPGEGGGPETNDRADWERWSAVLERAGVPHVPLHGARGSAASLLGELGVSDRLIADILGHASVKVTQGHYLHSSDTQRLDALTEAAAELGLGPLALPTSSPFRTDSVNTVDSDPNKD